MTTPDADSPTVEQLFDLSGRTALITGARGYLGRAQAAALAEAGARVIVSSRHRDQALAVAEELGGPQAGRHLAVCLDYLDESSLAEGFAEAVAQAARAVEAVRAGSFVAAPSKASFGGGSCANTCDFGALCRVTRQVARKARKAALAFREAGLA